MYETPVHRQVVNEIVFTNQATNISGVSIGTSGRVLISGTKLFLGNGAGWELISSAVVS